jgi:hypothetical protein
MPVRKKKKAHTNRLKVETAQHQKQFISEVKYIIEKTCGEDVLRYIPQEDFEQLYKYRFRPVSIRAAAGEDIPDDKLRFANCMISRLFKLSHVEINMGGLSRLSLYQYYSIGYTIMSYIVWLNDDEYPHAIEVKKALAPWDKIIESPIDEEAFDMFNGFMIMIAMFCSNVNDHLYTLEFNPKVLKRGLTHVGIISEMYKTQLPKVKIKIEEQLRPAWQVCWGYPGFDRQLIYISVKSEDVYLKPGRMFNVYIQTHALNRLTERLDGVEPGVLHFSIHSSLSEPKVSKSKSGFLMFEYEIFGNKAGYLLGEVVDEKIVIKTFLFLTNTGTPEADKLKAATGLMKEDIMYLDIDKLSTFVYSDIADNDRIRQLFIDAGCESLFKIDKASFSARDEDTITAKAEMIAKYLQVDTLPNYRGFKK